MPLTDFQRELLATLAPARTPESYLAGRAALHISPTSLRYSHDLHFFHDSAERVAAAFSEDSGLLEAAGYELDVALSQPGFIRAMVRKDGDATRIDWAHDSAWRFLPPVKFVRSRPGDEIGCLYYSGDRGRFEAPAADTDLAGQGLALHYGRPGGVLPRPADQELAGE